MLVVVVVGGFCGFLVLGVIDVWMGVEDWFIGRYVGESSRVREVELGGGGCSLWVCKEVWYCGVRDDVLIFVDR